MAHQGVSFGRLPERDFVHVRAPQAAEVERGLSRYVNKKNGWTSLDRIRSETVVSDVRLVSHAP